MLWGQWTWLNMIKYDFFFLILINVDPDEDWFLLNPTDLIWAYCNLLGWSRNSNLLGWSRNIISSLETH